MFKEKGMRTFADWLRYYTNLDVVPGLEALEKMRAFYTEKGIDILKDAVSIPGVLLAKVFKLLGKSTYGEMIVLLERQTNVSNTKDEKVVDKTLRSVFFSDLDEIGEAYELECRKSFITIQRPFQVGIAVYQLAKLRMLEFSTGSSTAEISSISRWTLTATTWR